jgi:RNA polymerase sigma factor (sigma-70 family)
MATGPKVFVVEDEPTVSAALSRALKAADFDVETFDSPDAFLQRLPIDGPACLLLDQHLPGMSGLDLQRMVGSDNTLPIIFMTGHAEVGTSIEAMKAGAIDFLLKPIDPTQLIEIVSQCLERSTRALEEERERAELRGRLARLTPRERQVCDLVAAGLLNKQIAAELGASEKTIKIHRSRVMRKLRVDSAAQLARLIERTTTDPGADSHSRP